MGIHAAILLFALAPPLQAQTIYTCTDAHGTSVFSQQPCAPQRKRAEVEAPQEPTRGTPNNIQYACKGPGGDWADAHCPGHEERTREALLVRAGQITHENNQRLADANMPGWLELCRHSYRCAQRHRDDYLTMLPILRRSATGSTASQCYQRWYKQTLDTVDARMWRHCYLNW